MSEGGNRESLRHKEHFLNPVRKPCGRQPRLIEQAPEALLFSLGVDLF